MKGQTALELVADYGCVHTHTHHTTAYFLHSRYYGEIPTVFATVAS